MKSTVGFKFGQMCSPLIIHKSLSLDVTVYIVNVLSKQFWYDSCITLKRGVKNSTVLPIVVSKVFHYLLFCPDFEKSNPIHAWAQSLHCLQATLCMNFFKVVL